LHFDAGAVTTHALDGAHHCHQPHARRKDRLRRRHEPVSRCRSLKSRTIGASLALLLLHPFCCVVVCWCGQAMSWRFFVSFGCGFVLQVFLLQVICVFITVEVAVALAAVVVVSVLLLLLLSMVLLLLAVCFGLGIFRLMFRYWFCCCCCCCSWRGLFFNLVCSFA
jgi:uncharacterized membrane protein YdbT with pleckstrin-like domain